MLSRPNVHLLAMLSRQKQLSQAPRASPASTNPRRGTTREPTVNGGLDDYEEDQEQSRREPSLASTDIEGILADLPSTAITRNSIQPSSADVGSSSDHVPAAPVVRSGFTPVNGAKRTQPQSQSQDTDDGFEYDDRRPDPRRRAQLDRDRRDMPPPPSRPRKRVRLSSTAAPPPPPPPSSSAPRQADSIPPSGSAPLPSSSSSSSSRSSLPSSTNSSGPSFRELSEMNRRAASRGPQQRVPWSDSDTRRLIRLIEYHNCLWALIAKRQFHEHRGSDSGPEVLEDCIFDHPRDQQAIRDKARNLKVDLLKYVVCPLSSPPPAAPLPPPTHLDLPCLFLNLIPTRPNHSSPDAFCRADLPLYPGFDGIALGKKERQALISRGKNPDRTEADVDADGNPMHTEYVPLGEEEHGI